MGHGECVENLFRHGGRAHVHGYFAHSVDSLFNLFTHLLQGFYLLGCRNGFVYLSQEIHKRFPFFEPQFPSQKVHGLDAVGAFIDAGYFAVPEELFLGVLLGESIAAIDLYALSTYIKGSVCTV